MERIFADQTTDTGIVGRLALRLVEDASSDGRRVGIDHSFSTGDFFRFEVTSTRDGRIYVFHRPPGGQLDLLWPDRGETVANAESAYQPFMVPSGEDAFRFTDEIGEEYFYVALSAVPNAPAAREEGVERFIARGLHSSAVSSRRRRVVVARPGEGLHVYFTTTTESADAALELRLRHEE